MKRNLWADLEKGTRKVQCTRTIKGGWMRRLLRLIVDLFDVLIAALIIGLMIKLLSNCLINLRIILAQEMHEWLLRREEAFTKWMILLIGCLGQQLREVSNDEAINPWPNESLTLWVNIKSIWHIALFHASPKKDIKTKGLTETVKTVCSSLCI